MGWMYLLFLGLLVPLIEVASMSTCPIGYEDHNGVCVDEDECEYDDPICQEHAVCFNTVGSYYCQCVPGFQIPSRAVNFTQSSGKCGDIDECSQYKDICGPHSDCINLPGSYYCKCKNGFNSSNGMEKFNATHGVECDDINECVSEEMCGKHTTCINTMGSFYCTCDAGYMLQSGQEKFIDAGPCTHVCVMYKTFCGVRGECEMAANSHQCVCRNESTNCSISMKRCTDLQCDAFLKEINTTQVPVELQQTLAKLSNRCLELGTCKPVGDGSLEPVQESDRLLQMLMGAIDTLMSAGTLSTSRKVTALLGLTEHALKLLGYLQQEGHITESSVHTEVEMLVRRSEVAPEGPLKMSTGGVQLESDWATAVGDSYLGFASVSLLSYKSLHRIFNNYVNWRETQETEKFKINSRVVTAVVTNPCTTALQKSIILTFFHLEVPVGNQTCVFWDHKGGVWSTTGCTVVRSSDNYTVCSCNHLSSFAVLMALYEQEDVFELQLITRVGLSLSLLCLFISILTFGFMRSIQSTRTTIHLHLCISLFIADVLFLTGITQTQSQVGCAFVAGLLHFFFLAVFCWMFLEGVQLFRMVVLVFNTTLRSRYLMGVGYGVPALIVAISAAVHAEGYGTKRHCWLNLEGGFIWSFFGPVCVIIVVNAFFFLITVWKLAEKFTALSQDLNNLHKIKTFTVTAIAQMCVLGTMWIFGCFQFDNGSLAMSFLFTIFNSLQGVLVFTMHCLLCRQVREEYVNILRRLCAPEKRKYSEFGTNQSSKSQVSGTLQHSGQSHI